MKVNMLDKVPAGIVPMSKLNPKGMTIIELFRNCLSKQPAAGNPIVAAAALMISEILSETLEQIPHSLIMCFTPNILGRGKALGKNCDESCREEGLVDTSRSLR